MDVILFLLSLGSFLGAVAVTGAAKSAVHEIQALMLVLISAVLLVGAFIVAALRTTRREIIEALDDEPDESATCPYCDESMSMHAIVCPHCRRDVPDAVVRARRATAS